MAGVAFCMHTDDVSCRNFKVARGVGGDAAAAQCGCVFSAGPGRDHAACLLYVSVLHRSPRIRIGMERMSMYGRHYDTPRAMPMSDREFDSTGIKATSAPKKMKKYV